MRINFRPTLIIALCIALGIFVGFLYLKYSTIATLILAVVLIVAVLLAAFFYLRFRNASHTRSKTVSKFILAFSAFTLIGFLLFFIGVNNFNKQSTLGGVADVTGTVFDSYKSTDGNYYILLEKVKFKIDDTEHKIKGKVFVYVDEDYSANKLNICDAITFKSIISTNDLLSDGYINTYAIRNNINYAFFIKHSEIESAEISSPITTQVRKLVRQTLNNNLSSENSNIAYALILGDSMHIESGLKSTFNDSGISHVFSVSGLHVSVLSLVIIFILKKLKLNNILQLIISSVVLLIYCAICGFVPAVTRSFIMIVVYLAASAFGAKYDGISSVSAAIVIMFIISPLTLFDAGFLLSASAVYSIFLLREPIHRILSFLPNKIATSLAVTLSAQIGLLPILFYFFNTFQLMSLLLNLIAVPIISAAYIILLAMVVIVAIIPQLGFIFFVPSGMIEIVKYIVILLEKTGLYTIDVKPLGIIVTILYYTLVIAISRMVLTTKKLRAVVSLSLCAVILVLTVYSYIPYKPVNTTFSAINVDGANLSIATLKSGDIILIEYGTEDIDLIELKNKLFLKGIQNIDLFISFAPNSAVKETAEFLIENYHLKNIALAYIYSDSLYQSFNRLIEKNIKIELMLSHTKFEYKDCIVAPFINEENYIGGTVIADNATTLYINDSSDKNLNYLINNMFLSVDLIFMQELNLLYFTAFNPHYLVVNKKVLNNYNQIHSVTTGGGLIFLIKNDKIILKYY